MKDDYAAAAKAIRGAKCVVALTGAGISAESGIPTFRGSGGIWEKYPPDEYATIDAYRDNPERVWRFWCEIAQMTRDCKPNVGHFTLATMEQSGFLHAIITQNVDNLHQTAGNTRVVEYHGNAHRLSCLKCRARRPLDPAHMSPDVPRCPKCTTLMKPDVVMFGEEIPPHALFEAHTLSERCDVMIVVGTSAQVYPASQLPQTARINGAFIIESNLEPTKLTQDTTHVFLKGPAGTSLPRLLDALRVS